METKEQLELKIQELKKEYARQTTIAESNKISLNSTFGKTASPHSILYAPEMTTQITVGGQLYLLMLIEALELAGVPVVSANTDGVLVKCPVAFKDAMYATIRVWEATTGFVTEEGQYRSFYSRDVNAYLGIKIDGTTKGKNIYYDPWKGSGAKDKYWCFQKNPTAQICVEAVELFLTKGIPLEQTITACRDITRFVAIKNATGGAHYDGEYLGKVVRWYYAREEARTINYIISNNKVPDTDGARPCMDLPEEFPNDVDFERYVKRCYDMLAAMGWKAPT